MEKHIKFDKPMPEAIKNALKDKRQWREKVQSGEIKSISKIFITYFMLSDYYGNKGGRGVL